MKSLHLLFTIYLLLLSFWPCADEKECTNGQAEVATIYTNQHTHTSEACTPFCSCTCCAASICLPATLTDFAFYKPAFITHYAGHLNPFQPRFSCSIWQPPQLVS